MNVKNIGAIQSASRRARSLRSAVICVLLIVLGLAPDSWVAAGNDAATKPKIVILDPPEKDFFSKQLDFHGVPIKAHMVVVDEALYAARERLSLLLTNLLTEQPMVLSNLVAAGAALHIIGRNQVTTDLPEWRHDKHVPLDEYNGLTRDRRTRGMGGLLTSCGEENVLKLPNDRYRGRDICLHEFSHSVLNNGCPRDMKTRFAEQRQKSLDKGLWVGSYAGSNADEYFAELTMWYFGTRGDLSMTGPKPEPGPEGLKKYDPEAYALVDDFYSGRIEVGKAEPRFRRPAGSTNEVALRPRRDSLVARGIVAKLSAYKTGVTKVNEFYTDAGMTGPGDAGKDGWHIAQQDAVTTQTNDTTSVETQVSYKFRVHYRNVSNRDFSLADLEFKDGVLATFVWNN